MTGPGEVSGATRAELSPPTGVPTVRTAVTGARAASLSEGATLIAGNAHVTATFDRPGQVPLAAILTGRHTLPLVNHRGRLTQTFRDAEGALIADGPDVVTGSTDGPTSGSMRGGNPDG